MADGPSNTPPELVATIEGHRKTVTAVLYFEEVDVLVTASEDKSVGLWKRSGDGYVRAVEQDLPSKTTALAWDQGRRHLLVGCDSGDVYPLTVADDWESVEVGEAYPMHSNRVTGICYDIENDWVISVGHDKQIRRYDLINNRLYGTRTGGAWLSALAVDAQAKRAFIGDFARNILIYDLTPETPTLLSKLSGHKGSIRALSYDADRQFLFSGSFDRDICCWDIGAPGKEFLAKLTGRLQGHEQKIKTFSWDPSSNTLMSGSDDNSVHVWDLNLGAATRRWRAHRGSVLAMTYSPRRDLLFTGSKDKTVKVWRMGISEADPITEGVTLDSGGAASYSDDGRAFDSAEGEPLHDSSLGSGSGSGGAAPVTMATPFDDSDSSGY